MSSFRVELYYYIIYCSSAIKFVLSIIIGSLLELFLFTFVQVVGMLPKFLILYNFQRTFLSTNSQFLIFKFFELDEQARHGFMLGLTWQALVSYLARDRARPDWS